MITRRAFAASPFLAAIVAACTGAQPTVAQIIADAQGLLGVVKATEAAIIAGNPKAISPATQATLAQLALDATNALNSLSTAATPPTTASVLQTVEAYLNPALTAIGAALDADPALNAKYGAAFNAAAALLVGVIEPYIAQVMATGTAPPPSPAMNKQRAIIGIKHS